MSPLLLLWMGAAPLAPVPLHAQAPDPAAAVAHLELWDVLLQQVYQLPLPAPEEEMVASPALIDLQRQAGELARWPGEDPIAETTLAYLSELVRVESELLPQLAELLYGGTPRDADLERAVAIWDEVSAIRLDGLNGINQVRFEFGQSQNVRMDPPPVLALPEPQGADLPGGAMSLPPSFRRSLASRHLSEVRTHCNQGVLHMNQAVRLSGSPEGDLEPLVAGLAQAQSELAQVPPWLGDASVRDACGAVLDAQMAMLQSELPALQAALEAGDLDTYNRSAAELSASLRALQLDLHDVEATFRLAWGLQSVERPAEQDTKHPETDQALARMRHWSSLVNQAAMLGTQMRINQLLDATEFQAEAKLASARLVELQGQADAPPPFDGQDSLRKPAIEVLDVLEQAYGVWGPQAAGLLATPKPRAEHQAAYQALMEEEDLAMDKALQAYRQAHQAFAEEHGINLVSGQTLGRLHPPTFQVVLPGPPVALPGQVRIRFAAAHQVEVHHAFVAGLEAWNAFIGSSAEEWPARLPQTRAVIDAAAKEVRSIPPWMEQELLISAAEEALSLWLDCLDKPVPRMIALWPEKTQKSVDKFNALAEELSQSSAEGVAVWNAANAQWASEWQYELSNAHREAMVLWAKDSRELLK